MKLLKGKNLSETYFLNENENWIKSLEFVLTKQCTDRVSRKRGDNVVMHSVKCYKTVTLMVTVQSLRINGDNDFAPKFKKFQCITHCT